MGDIVVFKNGVGVLARDGAIGINKGNIKVNGTGNLLIKKVAYKDVVSGNELDSLCLLRFTFRYKI